MTNAFFQPFLPILIRMVIIWEVTYYCIIFMLTLSMEHSGSQVTENTQLSCNEHTHSDICLHVHFTALSLYFLVMMLFKHCAESVKHAVTTCYVKHAVVAVENCRRCVDNSWLIYYVMYDYVMLTSNVCVYIA